MRMLEGTPSRLMSKRMVTRLPCEARGIGLLGVPVLRDLAVDDVDVVGEAVAEGAVLHGDPGGAVLDLHGGLGDADAGGLAGGGLGGRAGRAEDAWAARCGFSRDLEWAWCSLFRMRMSLGLGGGCGLLFGGDWGAGCGVLRGEDAGVERALPWRAAGSTETMVA